MLLLPVTTGHVQSGDDLAERIYKEGCVRDGDIVILSSKALAIAEGATFDLGKQNPSDRAKNLHKQTGRSPQFCEAILRELERMHGTILHSCPGAALTELRPEGLATGTILVANAGLDESNVPEGCAVGWPRDPVTTIARLRKELIERMQAAKDADDAKEERDVLRMVRPIPSGGQRMPSSASLASLASSRLAIILTDSCVHPRRQGVTAFALAASGLDPLQNLRGQKDLYGKPLTITTEAIADQLATAGNFLMGNAGQGIPAVIVRDHGLTLSDWEGWVPGIDRNEDLFGSLIR